METKSWMRSGSNGRMIAAGQICTPTLRACGLGPASTEEGSDVLHMEFS
jgi:hypothetical protein